MDKIFGIPTSGIALVLGILLGIILVVVVVVGLFQPVLVRMGLRNIPRRRAQTTLIIVGLMLASLIITASFGIGDTLAYSFKSFALKGYGNLDISISRYRPAATNPNVETPYLTQADVADLSANAKSNSKTQAIIPLIQVDSSMTDVTSKQVHSDSGIFAAPADFESLYGTTAQGSDGKPILVKDLKPGEVIATKELTKQLNAKPGDKITAFVGQQPVELTVRQTSDLDFFGQAFAIMNLADYQERAGKQGLVNQIQIVAAGANDDERIANANAVVKTIREQITDNKAATSLKELLGQQNVKDLTQEAARKQPDGSPIKEKLQQLQTETAKTDITPEFKQLVQDTLLAPTLLSLAPKLTPPQQVQLFTALDQISPFTVQAQKSDAVDQADLVASSLTVLFLVCGLFSILVGLLLIFLIFVMLAAERKPEMGMARALGIKRRHLTEMFIFEGTVYSAGAALVGVILGIGVGWVMVRVTAGLLSTFSDAFTFTTHIEPRSLVIAFCLGMLVTLIVVAFSAYRVSRLNIVAAIRDLPDEATKNDRLLPVLAAPFVGIPQGFRLLGRAQLLGFIVKVGWVVPALLGILLTVAGGGIAGILLIAAAFWTIVWAFIKRGPVLLLVGLALAAAGVSGLDRGTYAFGVSLMIIGVGLIVRWILRAATNNMERANRIGYSLAGLVLVLYWAKPFGSWENVLGLGSSLNYGKMDQGITLFFFSGVFLVVGSVWALMYNSDVLITGLMRALSFIGKFAPVTRTALAYPLQARFRTGMLLAMFSLITFTIIFMSVLVDINKAAVKDTTKLSGGWTITADANRSSAADIVLAKAKTDPKLVQDVEAVSAIAQKRRVPAHQAGKSDKAFAGQSVFVADTNFFDNNQFAFSSKAKGYENLSDKDLWQAVKNNPNLAVIDNAVLASGGGGGGGGGGGFGEPSLTISDVDAKAKGFAPVTLELRDAQNNIKTVTIIGFLDGPWFTFSGLFMSHATATTVFGGEPIAPTQFLYKVKPGVDTNQARLDIGAAYLDNGLEPIVLRDTIEKQTGFSNGFTQLLQGFLALGLLVGIAGLGVISTRAVVERRQQIGMLRAIGYSRGLVQLSFLLESSFIAILGLLLGGGLGILGAYTFLRDSNESSGTVYDFAVPWGQIALILIGSYLATLLTTYLPARAAARIYPAEALRYE